MWRTVGRGFDSRRLHSLVFMKKVKLVTLCLVSKDMIRQNGAKAEKQLLLGYKKRGLGKGLWNGFGGKVNKDEDVLSAARRELKEEACIEADKMELCGKLFFSFDGGEVTESFIFRTQSYIGEICESEEMKPKWFFYREIPYEKMWDDDVLWLPLILQGLCVLGYFHFDYQEKSVWGKVRTVPANVLKIESQFHSNE